MNKPADFVFTPTTKAPEPELGLRGIPVDRYTDPVFIKLEDDCIWSKTWLLAGAACDVAEPGDFLFSKPRESVLVTPQRMALFARSTTFASTGKSIEGIGVWNSPYLSCGFHGLEYHLDGSIKEIPEAHDFLRVCPRGAEPQRGQCEAWGFIWISMDLGIEPLIDILGCP
ncbi:MAG: hypothetical protein CM15mP103_09990 [Gammaproteobacteria bacterium]|nr:MAG: hypothetical protein CM15mP103_09990 [Gammaproteobacteria bacterium]